MTFTKAVLVLLMQLAANVAFGEAQIKGVYPASENKYAEYKMHFLDSLKSVYGKPDSLKGVALFSSETALGALTDQQYVDAFRAVLLWISTTGQDLSKPPTDRSIEIMNAVLLQRLLKVLEQKPPAVVAEVRTLLQSKNLTLQFVYPDPQNCSLNP